MTDLYTPLPGRLLLIGGGPLARSKPAPFMELLVAEAGGAAARISILTAGSDEPGWANVDYWKLLNAMGIKNLFSPHIATRAEADSRETAEQISGSDAVCIAGGSQARFMERIGGTATEKALRRVLQRGGVLAGTSSGASIFGSRMILTGGTQDPHLRPQMVECGDGMGLLGERYAIDTHCSSRGRLPRNIALLGEEPELRIVALDEDTGILIEADLRGKIIGAHAVYFLESGEQTASGNARTHVTLHCLTAGDTFDFRRFQPVSAVDSRQRIGQGL